MRLPASRPLLPIPLSVLLTLLWVGLVRLFLLWVTAQAGAAGDNGVAWATVLWQERVMGRARLPTIIVAVSLLLLIYLWADYRSRPARTNWRAIVFLAAAALLVYLVWGIWSAWWSHLPVPGDPGEMLMTAVPLGGVPV